MLVTLEEMKRHLREDGDEENGDIEALILLAQDLIYNMTGKRFTQNRIAKQCTKIIVTDCYNNRGVDGEIKYSKTAEMLLNALYYEVDGS